MKTCLPIFMIFILSVIINSFGSTGAYNTANITQVELSEANYEIVAFNVSGEA